MIPTSLYTIHWRDEKRGGEGMVLSEGAPLLFLTREGAAVWVAIHGLDVEQECEVVEYRRAEQGGEGE